MQQTAPAYLIIQLGNRWTDILRLQPDQPVLVGRSSDCQIVVKHEKVSRKHAEIAPQGGGWVVRDLGSRNGTQVDDLSIEGPHELKNGESISVGSCRMTFSLGLAGSFANRRIGASDGNLETQQTAEVEPLIVNRLAGSQWSSEGLAGAAARVLGNHQHGDDESWNFFYRLIFDMIAAPTPETTAQVALDRLLDRLQLTFGGVVTIDQLDTPDELPQMAVLATRQAKGASYHRVSDFLVQSVARDRQAVLARNVMDDSKLSVARASGQREVVSIICAPLVDRQLISDEKDSDETKSESQQERVIGLLHVYSAGDERMLTEHDLEMAVGVADNLAIALSRKQENEELTRSLESSRRRARLLEEQLDQSTALVGTSEELDQVRVAIKRAGPTNATVLVRGESGVGKELVARAIHASSKRSDGPLVCLNCAALAPTLLESELFGHEKGAFTGATERKIGKFEAAHGGTLLLDEIGEMSSELQAKFLRVLEGQPFERLGGNKSITTDVRVIAATNRDLEDAVKEKEFRADLYYRLRVIEIDVPPLRKRIADIPVLVEHFIELLRHHAGRRLDGIAPSALELLTRHSWPGNVRELRNVIERAIVLGGSSTIELQDLSIASLGETSPPRVGQAEQADDGSAFRPIPLADLEREHIFAMLEFTDGNKTKAAQKLGIERSTLDRKLKKY